MVPHEGEMLSSGFGGPADHGSHLSRIWRRTGRIKADPSHLGHKLFVPHHAE